MSSFKYDVSVCGGGLENLDLTGLAYVNCLKAGCACVCSGDTDLNGECALNVGDSIAEHKLDLVCSDEGSNLALLCKSGEVDVLKLIKISNSGKGVTVVDTCAAYLNDNVLGLEAVGALTGGNGKSCLELCGLGEVRIGRGELSGYGVDTNLDLAVALVGNGDRLGKSAGDKKALSLVVEGYACRIECNTKGCKVICKVSALDGPFLAIAAGEGNGVVRTNGDSNGGYVCACVNSLCCNAIVGSGVGYGYDACELSRDSNGGVSKLLAVVGGVGEVSPGKSTEIDSLGADLPFLVVNKNCSVVELVVCLVLGEQRDGSLCVVDTCIGLFVVGIYYGKLVAKTGGVKGYGDSGAGVGDGSGVVPLESADGDNCLCDLPLLIDGNGAAAYLIAAYGKNVVSGGEKLNGCTSGVLACILTGRGSAGDLKESELLSSKRGSIKVDGDVGAGVGEGIGVIPGEVNGNCLLCDNVSGRHTEVTAKNVVGSLGSLNGYGNAVGTCIGGVGCCNPSAILVLLVNVLEYDALMLKVLKLGLLGLCVVGEFYLSPLKVVGRDHCLCDRPLLGGDGAAYVIVGSNKGIVNKIKVCACDDLGCCVGSSSVGVNDCCSEILGSVVDLNTEYGAVVGEVELCGIVGCISYAVCTPGKGGEVDRLCSYRPVAAGKLSRACPYVVSAADNLNGCGGYVGACVGLCVVGKSELKLCGIVSGYGVGLAVLVNHILRNYPLDIAVVISLGIDGPLEGNGVTCGECVICIKELKGCGSGVLTCVGSGVAGDAGDAYKSLILSLDGSVYALLGSIVLKSVGVVPLYNVGSGDRLRIDLNAYLVGGLGLSGAKNVYFNYYVVLAGVSNVSDLKGCSSCAVDKNVVLVPSVCIGCGLDVGSYVSGEDDGAVTVYDSVSGSGELSSCISSNCVKCNVCCGHLGISVALCVYPSDDGHSAVLGSAGEEVYVSAYGKEALANKLGALVVAYLVNVVEGNLNSCGYGDHLVVKECIDKVAYGFAYLVCGGVDVNGLGAACLELTVGLVEVKESELLYGLGKIAVSLCEVVKSYVVVLSVLLDLSLDLCLGKAVKDLEPAEELVVENFIEVNVLKDLHKIVEGNVVDERVHLVYVSGEAAEYLLLDAVGYSGGLASLESCLSKLIGNVNLKNVLAVLLGDGKVSCDDRSNLSYALVSAAKLDGYVELALAEVGVKMECVRKLHFIVGHLGNSGE